MKQREYSRHRGCALFAVQKAITSGRIAAAVNPVTKLIDSEKADQLWALATDAAMQRKEPPPPPPAAALPILEGVVETAPSALSRRPVWEVPFPPVPTPEERAARSMAQVAAAALSNQNVVDGATFMEWKTREQRANALAAERELDAQEKRSLDASETLKAIRTMGKMYAEARETVPAQLAPQLVGLVDLAEIERRVRAMYRAADQRIANEIRNRFADLSDAVAAG